MNDKVTAIQPVKLPQGLKYRPYIHPMGKPIPGVYVPVPELELFIQAFLMMHRSDDREETPRTALVQSIPGTGKSASCFRAAAKMSAVARVPPSIFGSKHESGAVENLTELMHACEAYSKETGEPTCVLIEDVDASTLSVSENTGHTVNTKEIIGHMQLLSDSKNIHVNADGSCIPFLCTANAASEVRASLFRDMRASVYTHTVPENVKREIVNRLFAPASPEEQRIVDKLFHGFRTEQPAFWKQLRHDYRARRIQSVVARHGADSKAVNAELARRVPLDAELLHDLARHRRAARPHNFLFNRKK